MADLVIFNDRKYYPQFPPSEQIDALTITSKWPRLGLDEAAKVSISETELRNYAQIFPRLYQVPEKSQARLRAWMERNEETTQGWDVGDFFKTPDDDARDHTIPRNQGCPDEAMEAWKSSFDGQETDQASVDQEPPANSSDNHPLISQESKRARRGQGGQGTEKGCQTIQALEGSLGKITEVAARLEQLSNNLYLEDSNSVKEELLALAQTIYTNIDSTSRARNIVSQMLGKGAVDRRLGKWRQRNRIAKAKRDKNKNKNNNNDENENNDEDGNKDDKPMADIDPRLKTAFIGSYQLHTGPVNDLPGPQDDDPMADIDSPLSTASMGSYQLCDGPVNDLPGPQDDDSMAEAVIHPRLRTAFIGSYQLRNEDSFVGYDEE